MSTSKRHLNHLPPVLQRRGRELKAVPFLAAGLVLLRSLRGGYGCRVMTERCAVERKGGAPHLSGGDLQLAKQGWPVPAFSQNSVFHCVPQLVAALCRRSFVGSMTGKHRS